MIHAYEQGALSLRQFDQLSRLGLGQQRWTIAAEKAKSAAAFIAAQTINDILSRQVGQVRLSEISLAIRDALGALAPGPTGRRFQ